MTKVETEDEDRQNDGIDIKEEINYFVDSEDNTNFDSTAFLERRDQEIENKFKEYKIVLTQLENLVRSKRFEGDVESKFFCIYCNYKSNRKFNYSRHMRLIHPELSKGYLNQNLE